MKDKTGISMISNASTSISVQGRRNPNIGRRTGVDIKAGKNIRTNKYGFEEFDDYWTETEDESESILLEKVAPQNSKKGKNLNKSKNRLQEIASSEIVKIDSPVKSMSPFSPGDQTASIDIAISNGAPGPTVQQTNSATQDNLTVTAGTTCSDGPSTKSAGKTQKTAAPGGKSSSKSAKKAKSKTAELGKKSTQPESSPISDSPHKGSEMVTLVSSILQPKRTGKTQTISRGTSSEVDSSDCDSQSLAHVARFQTKCGRKTPLRKCDTIDNNDGGKSVDVSQSQIENTGAVKNTADTIEASSNEDSNQSQTESRAAVTKLQNKHGENLEVNLVEVVIEAVNDVDDAEECNQWQREASVCVTKSQKKRVKNLQTKQGMVEMDSNETNDIEEVTEPESVTCAKKSGSKRGLQKKVKPTTADDVATSTGEESSQSQAETANTRKIIQTRSGRKKPPAKAVQVEQETELEGSDQPEKLKSKRQTKSQTKPKEPDKLKQQQHTTDAHSKSVVEPEAHNHDNDSLTVISETDFTISEEPQTSDQAAKMSSVPSAATDFLQVQSESMMEEELTSRLFPNSQLNLLKSQTTINVGGEITGSITKHLDPDSSDLPDNALLSFRTRKRLSYSGDEVLTESHSMLPPVNSKVRKKKTKTKATIEAVTESETETDIEQNLESVNSTLGARETDNETRESQDGVEIQQCGTQTEIDMAVQEQAAKEPDSNTGGRGKRTRRGLSKSEKKPASSNVCPERRSSRRNRASTGSVDKVLTVNVGPRLPSTSQSAAEGSDLTANVASGPDQGEGDESDVQSVKIRQLEFDSPETDGSVGLNEEENVEEATGPPAKQSTATARKDGSKGGKTKSSKKSAKELVLPCNTHSAVLELEDVMASGAHSDIIDVHADVNEHVDNDDGNNKTVSQQREMTQVADISHEKSDSVERSDEHDKNSEQVTYSGNKKDKDAQMNRAKGMKGRKLVQTFQPTIPDSVGTPDSDSSALFGSLDHRPEVAPPADSPESCSDEDDNLMIIEEGSRSFSLTPTSDRPEKLKGKQRNAAQNVKNSRAKRVANKKVVEIADIELNEGETVKKITKSAPRARQKQKKQLQKSVLTSLDTKYVTDVTQEIESPKTSKQRTLSRSKQTATVPVTAKPSKGQSNSNPSPSGLQKAGNKTTGGRKRKGNLRRGSSSQTIPSGDSSSQTIPSGISSVTGSGSPGVRGAASHSSHDQSRPFQRVTSGDDEEDVPVSGHGDDGGGHNDDTVELERTQDRQKGGRQQNKSPAAAAEKANHIDEVIEMVIAGGISPESNDCSPGSGMSGDFTPAANNSGPHIPMADLGTADNQETVELERTQDRQKGGRRRNKSPAAAAEKANHIDEVIEMVIAGGISPESNDCSPGSGMSGDFTPAANNSGPHIPMADLGTADNQGSYEEDLFIGRVYPVSGPSFRPKRWKTSSAEHLDSDEVTSDDNSNSERRVRVQRTENQPWNSPEQGHVSSDEDNTQAMSKSPRPRNRTDSTPYRHRSNFQKFRRHKRVTISSFILPSPDRDTPVTATPAIVRKSILKTPGGTNDSPVVHIFEMTTSQTPHPAFRPLPDMTEPHMSSKLILPDEAPPDGVRRSTRTRLKPLEWFKNERPVYDKRKSGGFVIVDVAKPNNDIQKSKDQKLKRKAQQIKRKQDEERKRKRLSLHVNLPSDAELEETGDIMVRDASSPDKEILMNCVQTQPSFEYWGPSGRAVDRFDPYIICKIMQEERFSAGELILRPKEEKPTTTVAQFMMIFHIMEGKLAVTIHRTTSILQTRDVFCVPPGNTYSLRNLRNDTAKLFFTQLRGTGEKD